MTDVITLTIFSIPIPTVPKSLMTSQLDDGKQTIVEDLGVSCSRLTHTNVETRQGNLDPNFMDGDERCVESKDLCPCR